MKAINFIKENDLPVQEVGLKELIKQSYNWHSVHAVSFFDEANKDYDAVVCVQYRVFANSPIQIVCLGEGQIRKLAKKTQQDTTKAINELEQIILKGCE
jgi:hypothetical protein